MGHATSPRRQARTSPRARRTRTRSATRSTTTRRGSTSVAYGRGCNESTSRVHGRPARLDPDGTLRTFQVYLRAALRARAARPPGHVDVPRRRYAARADRRARRAPEPDRALRVDPAEAIRRLTPLQGQHPPAPYIALAARLEGFARADLEAAIERRRGREDDDHAADAAPRRRRRLPRLRAAHPPGADARPGARPTRTSTRSGSPPSCAAWLARAAHERRDPRARRRLRRRDGRPVDADHLRPHAAAARPAPARRALGRQRGAPSFVARPAAAARPGRRRRARARALPRARSARRAGATSPPGRASPSATSRRRGSALETVSYRDEQGTSCSTCPARPLPPADTPLPLRLLAHWDQPLLAYADRERIIPPEMRPLKLTLSGDPTVTVDGRVAASWAIRDDVLDGHAARRAPARRAGGDPGGGAANGRGSAAAKTWRRGPPLLFFFFPLHPPQTTKAASRRLVLPVSAAARTNLSPFRESGACRSSPTCAGSPKRSNASRPSSGAAGHREKSSSSVVRVMNAVIWATRSPSIVITSSANGRCARRLVPVVDRDRGLPVGTPADGASATRPTAGRARGTPHLGKPAEPARQRRHRPCGVLGQHRHHGVDVRAPHRVHVALDDLPHASSPSARSVACWLRSGAAPDRLAGALSALFTDATVVSSASAVSAAEKPSTSRRISTARWLAGRCWSAAMNASSTLSRCS